MVKVIAHRGARSLAPENTLAAFRRAFTLPVAAIEADVALTKDGVPILIHQETLVPDTSFKRLHLTARNEARSWVSENNWARIKDVDAGSWFSTEFAGEPIPRLEDVLNLDWNEKTLVLDLIDPFYWIDSDDSRAIEQFEKIVVPMLKEAHKKRISFSVLAFNPKMLELFHQELPNIHRTLALWTNQSGKTEWIGNRAAELGVSTLAIADFMLRDEPDWEKLARSKQLELGVYELTPDSHAEFSQWTPAQRRPMWDLVIEKKVDWFTSDFPAEFASYRDTRGGTA